MQLKRSTLIWLGALTLAFGLFAYATICSFQLSHPAIDSDPIEFAKRVRHAASLALGLEAAVYLMCCALVVWWGRRK